MRLRLEEELQRLQTKVVGLQANLQLREDQHAEVEHKIGEILDSERDLEQIERDIKMADTRLDLLRQKHEEARVLSEMQADRISNLTLFQPATLVERPASPNKKLLFLAFAVLGLDRRYLRWPCYKNSIRSVCGLWPMSSVVWGYPSSAAFAKSAARQFARTAY